MSEEITAGPAAQQSLLLTTFRKVMRPLVRLFLTHQVTYPMLIEELKRVFVDIADRDFKLDGRAQTDSRITLLTGVHRRDVNRLRSMQEHQKPAKTNFSAAILAQWLGNPAYLDEAQQPLPLPKTSRASELSFESLVAEVSKDIRARPVLDEWLHTGIVRLNENQLVELNQDAFVTTGDFEGQLEYLAMNLHDHAAAAVHNVIAGAPPFLERCVYYRQLTPEQTASLHQLARARGMKLLLDLNKQALLMEAANTAQSVPATMRMNVGIYFYAEPDDAATPATIDKP